MSAWRDDAVAAEDGTEPRNSRIRIGAEIGPRDQRVHVRGRATRDFIEQPLDVATVAIPAVEARRARRVSRYARKKSPTSVASPSSQQTFTKTEVCSPGPSTSNVARFESSRFGVGLKWRTVRRSIPSRPCNGTRPDLVDEDGRFAGRGDAASFRELRKGLGVGAEEDIEPQAPAHAVVVLDADALVADRFQGTWCVLRKSCPAAAYHVHQTRHLDWSNPRREPPCSRA